MPKALEAAETRGGSRWWKRRPPTGIAGAVFWLALWFGLLWLFRQVPSRGSGLLGWMQLLVGVALVGLAVPLAWRLVRQHLLWSLRNKLILTYLLIGLAPVVLFVTLVAISAYIAAGQFSIHLADSRLSQHLEEIGVENSARASGIAHFLRTGEGPGRPPQARGSTRQGAETVSATAANRPAAPADSSLDPLRARLHRHSSVYLNGVALPDIQGAQAAALQPSNSAPDVPLGFPVWAADLRGNQFRGITLDGEDLFLVAIDQRQIEGKGMLTVITSLPVNSALLEVMAEGLGRVGLCGTETDSTRTASGSSSNASTPQKAAPGTQARNPWVYGGSEPRATKFYDVGVPFVSTLEVTDWDTGARNNVPVEVHSRPSQLYRQLFGSSIGGTVTSYIRNGLIALCILFALIEALALWMARRLSLSITTSVEELYAATQRVDRGDFVHRISATVTGEKDQLGELARSFNRMTGSLERLMHEQQEKERLQSELTIAQEVQANLFPHHVRDLPTLELHGICRPARSVSGDYYDFLVFHHPTEDGKPARESGLGIALGDISGKGISAALLMATLHSAVRAYRLASEDVVYSESSLAGLMVSRESATGDGGKLFESPGRILAMLNRHLYRSTQPEKYATLFLAHYDAATARLTYSNAGHLPPLVLGRDGRIRRLDCGGTVVGLMDGMRYQDDTFPLHSGDLLVAYSDGITEPENDFGEFGEARLMEVVGRYRDQPLDVISAQVMLALDAWIGAEEQPDDITLVLARQV